jgi:glycosyltransferase involved in cell wall biosynthesis
MTGSRKVLEVLGRSAGGIAGHVAAVAAGLQGRSGLEIAIAGPPEVASRMPREILPLTIPDGVWGHRKASGQLQELMTDGGYDVVHAHGLRAALDSARAARGTPASALATIHNLVLPEISGPLRARAYRRAEPVAVRWNERVFAPSRDIAQHLRAVALSDASKVEVLHLGVSPPPRSPREPAQVRAELGVDPGQHLLVTVARLAPQKALDVLLTAFARLPATVHLAIIGGGPLHEQLKTLAAEMGVAPRVGFLGYRSEPADYVAAADVFCLTSVWEACSLAAQEAITLGVPVVTTAVGGMPELIEDRVSGRLVASGDPEGFAAAVTELLATPDDARRMAANAKVHLAENFSSDRMLERLERAYLGLEVETA